MDMLINISCSPIGKGLDNINVSIYNSDVSVDLDLCIYVFIVLEEYPLRFEEIVSCTKIYRIIGKKMCTPLDL